METSHRRIEDEFYDIDPPSPPEADQELLAKAYCYLVYFNTQRRNSNKGYKTPLEILQTLAPYVSSQVLVLPPVILDNLITHYTPPGYHVPELTVSVVHTGMSLQGEIPALPLHQLFLQDYVQRGYK